MSDATSGLIPADRRNFLLGTGAAAGAMVLGTPLRSPGSRPRRDHLRQRQVLRQGDPGRGRRGLQSGAEQGPRDLCRAAAAQLLDRGPSGAGAATGAPDRHARRLHAGRGLDRRVCRGRLGAAAGRGFRRQEPARLLPRHDRRLHLRGQADGPALVRRFRHALLPQGSARGHRRQGARDLGRPDQTRAGAA